MNYEQIAREILDEAAATDADEDSRYGERRGDEMPEGLRGQGRTRPGARKEAMWNQRPVGKEEVRAPACAACA